MMTITKKGIAAEIAGQFTVMHDGNIVLHGPGTVHYTGDFVGRDRYGFDSSSLSVGTGEANLQPGETLIVASRADLQAAPGDQWARASYWSVPGRSNIDEMLAVVCVPWPQSAVACFRPPALGMSLVSKFLRNTPIPLGRMQMDKLPRTIDMDAITTRMPVEYYERLFADFCGDIYDGWSTDTRTPDLQHPGYGTFLAGVVSQALVWLCADTEPEKKRVLATKMVQWGLDLAGAFADGRDNSAIGGGHMAGRKAMVILAGHLLDAPPIADPNSYVGKVFMEDNAFTPRGWRHSVGAEQSAGPWAEKRIWSPQTRQAMRYIDQVTGAQIGTALAMQLMGLRVQMGVDHYNWCKRWVDDDRDDMADVKACYDVNDLTPRPSWGKDYAVGGGLGMCEAAWRQVDGGVA